MEKVRRPSEICIFSEFLNNMLLGLFPAHEGHYALVSKGFTSFR